MPVFSGTARRTGKALKTDVFNGEQAKIAAHLKEFRAEEPAVKTVESDKATVENLSKVYLKQVEQDQSITS